MSKKKFYGSLASRITFGIFALLIFPLLIFAGLIWERDWDFYPHLFLTMAVIFFIGAILTVWLVKRIARPLVQLNKVINQVTAKDTKARYVPDQLGFEINQIGKQFNHMLDNLLFAMEKAKKEKIARELLRKELQIGYDIQKSLLPKEIPDFPSLQMGAKCIPAKEVSGDFYDLFAVDGNQMLLTIADGSDKGISACLHSLIIRSMLRSQLSSDEEMAKSIKQINHLFCQDTGDTGNFVTAWVGVYHTKYRSLSYTSVGHLPAILIQRDGSLEELTTDGIAFGVDEMPQVEIKMKTLPPSSLLFLYTDGVIEAQNERGELFGKARLIGFLKDSRSLEPQLLIDNLVKEIRQFVGEAAVHDDLTALCLLTL